MARLLLDTHVLLWSLAEPARLRDRARHAIEDPDNDVFVSASPRGRFRSKSLRERYLVPACRTGTWR